MTSATTSATSTPAPVITSDTPIVLDANNTVTSPIIEATPADSDPSPAASTEPAKQDDNQPQKQTPDWAQKRINELTAKRYEAERLAQEATDRAKAAELRAADLLEKMSKGNNPQQPPQAPANDYNSQQQQQPQNNKPVIAEDEIERRAVEKAAQIARANEFNKACNNIVDVGKKEYKETWDEAIKNLNMVGAIGDKVSPAFLENAIELKDPHKVLHYLGTNIEEGARIAALPPTRQAMELARIESALGAPPVEQKPVVSSAPSPVIPVGGQGRNGIPQSIDDPNLSAEDWYALRAKQLQEKKNRYLR